MHPQEKNGKGLELINTDLVREDVHRWETFGLQNYHMMHSLHV